MINLELLLQERIAAGTDISDHLAFLKQITIDKDAKIVMEIGVRGGESTIAFLTGLEKTGGFMYSCDLNPPSFPVNSLYGKTPWDHFAGGDRNYVGYSEQLGIRGRVDLLHIDTSHNYEDTKFELENFVPYLNETGVLLMHDVDPESMYPDQMRAIHEWCANNPQWHYTYRAGNNGMAVIYRDETHLRKV
jgi:predicted O-methyltransferase YrrM